MPKEKEHNELGETSPIQVIGEGGDAIDEKKLLRKLDWHLVPGLTVLFLLSFLDRSNGSPSLSLSLVFPLSHLFFSWKCSYRGSRRRHTHECVSLQRP